MSSDIQNRGICQICGREQAVRSAGNITHHGYTIEYGWYHGTCPGQQHKPLQHDKTETERQIKLISEELPSIEKTIAKLKAGKLRPKQINLNHGTGARAPKMVDWADAPEWAQNKAITTAIYAEERRLKAGRDTIVFLKQLIVNFYGKELKKVVKPNAANKPQIQVGSKVKVHGKEQTVLKIEYARAQGVGPGINGQTVEHVFWEQDGKVMKYPKRYVKLIS